MRLLFLCPVLPWPVASGGTVRTAALLGELGRAWKEEGGADELQIELWAGLSPAQGPPERAREEAAPLLETCAKARLFPIDRWRPRLDPHLRLRACKPARWFHSTAMARALAQSAAHAPWDAVHLDEMFAAHVLPRGWPSRVDGLRTAPPLLVHHHKLDCEFHARTLPRGPLRPWHVSRLRAAEKDAAARTPDHAFCSAEDARLFRARHPGIRAHVVPNGADARLLERPAVERDPSRLLFLGSLDYAPNAQGLTTFLHEVWPAVLQRMPELRLSIVGGGRAPDSLRAAARAPGVDWIGAVEDPAPHLDSAALALVPLAIGGGSRLKIFEALAAALPVLSTEVGAEGAELTPGVHIETCADIRAFAAALPALMRDPARRARQAAAGRERVRAHHTWPRIARRLARVYRTISEA